MRNTLDGRYILKDIEGMTRILQMIRDYVEDENSIPEKVLTNLNEARDFLNEAFTELRKEY